MRPSIGTLTLLSGPHPQVENLFYNTTARLSALRSSSEEYARILDVLTKYAVHNAGVSFVCKKVRARVRGLRRGICAHAPPFFLSFVCVWCVC